MLVRSGDLIPVLSEALNIPWNKRKTLIYNHLYKGSVNFQTLVYDTNVGDVSPISTYFNPKKWTVDDLNNKFGIQSPNFRIPSPTLTDSGSTVSATCSKNDSVEDSDKTSTSSVSGDIPKDKSIIPKLVIIPDDSDGTQIDSNANSMLFPAKFDFKVPPPPLNYCPVAQTLPLPMVANPGPAKVYFDPRIKPSNRQPEVVEESNDQFNPQVGQGVNLIDISQIINSGGYFQNSCEHQDQQSFVPLNLINLCHPLNELAMYQATFNNPWNMETFGSQHLDESHLSGTNVTNGSSFAFDMSLESYLPQNLNDYINNGSYNGNGSDIMHVLEMTV